MALSRPSLATLIARTRADMGLRVLGSSTAVIRKSVLDAISIVIAGVAHGLYGFITWSILQALPDRATDGLLERWAAIFGITRTAGTVATGTVEFTGTNSTVIAIGTRLVRSDGLVYETTAGGTISGGVLSLAIEAVEVGADYDADAGLVLQTESSLAGVDADVTIESPGLDGGSDLESNESLRTRLLLRIRKPPQGGTETDYEQWSLASNTTITRAWGRGGTPTGGYITAFVVADDGAGGTTPSPTAITAVENYIEERRPATATVIVSAPTEVAFDPTIALSPDTSAVRTAVEAELQSMLLARSEPGQNIRISWIREAISQATGEDYHTLSLPATDVVIAHDEIAVLGTITWT